MRHWLAAAWLAFLIANPLWAAGPWGNPPSRGQQDRGARPDNRGSYNGNVPPPPQDQRMQRDAQRRGALTDEERRGLHRDLDKANRELYRRR